MKTKRVETKSLIGAALDWAVAICEGIRPFTVSAGAGEYAIAYVSPNHGGRIYFRPSIDGATGVLIMQKNGIGVLFRGGNACRPSDWFATPDDQQLQTSYEGEQFEPAFMVDESEGCLGPTLLVAAMRVYVLSKCGESVEIPEELVK